MMVKLTLPHGLIKKILIALGFFSCAFSLLIILVVYFGETPSGDTVADTATTEKTSEDETFDDLASNAVDDTVRDPDAVRREHIDLISKKMAEALARGIAVPKPENPLELFF